MNSEELRALQKPLKETYKTNPEKAQWTLHAESLIQDDITCAIKTDIGEVKAGLHPATGGDGTRACSGDMLLQALVACAGVTLKSVATAMDIEIKSATVRAEGKLDFRGTLGVSKEVPVGFEEINLFFDIHSHANEKKVKKLVELAERYCVVYQTLKNGPETSTQLKITHG